MSNNSISSNPLDAEKPGEVVLQGWLKKRSPKAHFGVQVWQSRYFILRGASSTTASRLEYSKSSNSTSSLIGSIPLSSILSMIHPEKDTSESKKIANRVNLILLGGRIFELEGENEADVSRWMSAISETQKKEKDALTTEQLTNPEFQGTRIHHTDKAEKKKYWKKKRAMDANATGTAATPSASTANMTPSNAEQQKDQPTPGGSNGRGVAGDENEEDEEENETEEEEAKKAEKKDPKLNTFVSYMDAVDDDDDDVENDASSAANRNESSDDQQALQKRGRRASDKVRPEDVALAKAKVVAGSSDVHATKKAPLDDDDDDSQIRMPVDSYYEDAAHVHEKSSSQKKYANERLNELAATIGSADESKHLSPQPSVALTVNSSSITTASNVTLQGRQLLGVGGNKDSSLDDVPDAWLKDSKAAKKEKDKEKEREEEERSKKKLEDEQNSLPLSEMSTTKVPLQTAFASSDSIVSARLAQQSVRRGSLTNKNPQDQSLPNKTTATDTNNEKGKVELLSSESPTHVSQSKSPADSKSCCSSCIIL